MRESSRCQNPNDPEPLYQRTNALKNEITIDVRSGFEGLEERIYQLNQKL